VFTNCLKIPITEEGRRRKIKEKRGNLRLWLKKLTKVVDFFLWYDDDGKLQRESKKRRTSKYLKGKKPDGSDPTPPQ
jgi:hypothetical protein